LLDDTEEENAYPQFDDTKNRSADDDNNSFTRA